MSYHLVGCTSYYYYILDTSDLALEVITKDDLEQLNGIKIEGIEPDTRDYSSLLKSKLALIGCRCDIFHGVLTSLTIDDIVLSAEGLRGIFIQVIVGSNITLRVSDNLYFIAYGKECRIVGLTLDVSDVTRNDLLVMAYSHTSVNIVDSLGREDIIRPVANMFNRKRDVIPVKSMSVESDELFCSLFQEYINKSLDICILRCTNNFDKYVNEYKIHRNPKEFDRVLSGMFDSNTRYSINILIMYIVQGGRNPKMHDKYRKLCKLCSCSGRYVL